MAFDASSEAMVILDQDLRVRWANQQAADLWANGMAIQLPGKRIADLLNLHRLDGCAISESDAHHPLQRINAGDGKDRYLMHRTGNPSRQLCPLQISWRSIPQIKQPFWLLRVRDLEPQEQALFEQKQFINQLTHELRTPLAIVLGSLKRIERVEGLDTQSARQLKIAREEARRINRLLVQLTALSELDTGRYKWQLQSNSLMEFLQGWIAQLNPQVRRQLDLDIADTAQQLCVHLDQQAFNQAMNNLVDNSMRYCPPGSPILLRVAPSSNNVELLLIDWGPGIPEEEYSQIFARFNRLEHHRDVNRSDGAGLGLAVVKQFIEGMNGEVTLMPNRTADGSSKPGLVVKIRLPVASQISDGS